MVSLVGRLWLLGSPPLIQFQQHQLPALSAMNALIVNIPNSCCSGWCVQSSRCGLRDRLRSECLLRAGEVELSALRSVSRGVLGGERERDLERPLQQQHTVVPQRRQHHFLCSGFL